MPAAWHSEGAHEARTKEAAQSPRASGDGIRVAAAVVTGSFRLPEKHEDTNLGHRSLALVFAICPKRFLNLSESTVLYALRQIVFNRCAGREPGSSPCPRIRVPLPE